MIWRNEASQANQTEFVDQVPLIEAQQRRVLSWSQLRSNKNLRPFYLLIGLFIFLVVLLFLRLLLSKPEPEVIFEPTPVAPREVGPLHKRVYELREELRANDPTKQHLPFPQVDLQFNIN